MDLSGNDFSNTLAARINRVVGRCTNEINSVTPFGGKISKHELETLARDTACRFLFPQSADEAMEHQAMLKNSIRGLCQFISGYSPDDLEGHAFVPLPVLQHNYQDVPGRRYPCGGALTELTNALSEFGEVEIRVRRGKLFEKVALASFLDPAVHSCQQQYFLLASIFRNMSTQRGQQPQGHDQLWCCGSLDVYRTVSSVEG